ncbi:MAG: outer membrane lipoprotein-sorting protein [Treponema sp.]|jgi:outer membrane lipoprotein-sorting protein|nr:outer membrane lipoprotein-sorting protein [Treponema sp.]
MKKVMFAALFAGLLAGAALALYAQDAARPADAVSIVRESRDRIRADTVSTRSRMVIQAKSGSTSERLIDQYSKDGPRGKRTVIVFQRPETVAGTRFLTMENSGGADDRWIFLPGVGKVRRMAASEGSSSFVGTDFSYDDIASASRSADLDTHTLLREESLDGTACYVIQSVPRDSSYQYSKMILWIAKDTKLTLKIELYDRRNALVKVAEMSGLREVQGRLTATVTKMTTIAAESATTIFMDIVKYDDPIPEAVFTTAFLETGRAR